MTPKLAASLAVSAALICTLSIPAVAHHSVLHYDGKKIVTISGVVTKARFGYPHSIYRIEVTAEDGSKEEWVLSTEDPRDAKRLGFDEEIKNLKPGDEITVVGWPHQYVERELRGHQLHYPDGRVVIMRTGNYIWPKDILRLDKFVMNPQNIPKYLDDVDPAGCRAAHALDRRRRSRCPSCLRGQPGSSASYRNYGRRCDNLSRR